MELELYENLARPVFMVENKHHYCLLDTGALFPIWCSSVKALHVRYPESYATNDILPLSGFGGRGEMASVYIIPEFKITQGKHCMIFENYPIAISEKIQFRIFNMIMPAFLFRESVISLKVKNGKANSLQIDVEIERPVICKVKYLVKDNMVVSFEGQNVVEQLICFTQNDSEV